MNVFETKLYQAWIISLLGLAPLSLTVTAEEKNMLAPTLEVYPAHVTKGEGFLISLNGYWPNSCGGRFYTEIVNDRMIFTADPVSRTSRISCAEIIVPFNELINPEDMVENDFVFADTVTVEYHMYRINGEKEKVGETELIFSDIPNKNASIESGYWVTDKLSYSSLTIDQQSNMISTTLSDYDIDGNPVWFFSSGTMNGNTYIGEITRYTTNVACIPAQSCPRAIAEQTGHIYILVNDNNDLTVKATGLKDSQFFEDYTARYRRNVLSVNPLLPQNQIDLPDLTGRWIVGFESDTSRSEYNQYIIEYTGVDDSNQNAVEKYLFSAKPVNTVDTNMNFSIECADYRILDGDLSCSINNITYLQSACIVNIPFSAVGNRKVDVSGVPCEEKAVRLLMLRSD